MVIKRTLKQTQFLSSRQFEVFIQENPNQNTKEFYLHLKTFSGYCLSFFYKPGTVYTVTLLQVGKKTPPPTRPIYILPGFDLAVALLSLGQGPE